MGRGLDLRQFAIEPSLVRNRAERFDRLWNLVPGGDTLYDDVCREARFRHIPVSGRRSEWFEEIHSIGLTAANEAFHAWPDAFDDRWIVFAKQSIHRAIERAHYHERKHRNRADPDWNEVEARSEDPARIVAIEDERERVRILIDRLSAEDRHLVESWFFKNESQAAIGRSIGKSQAYVSERIQKLLACLREWIERGE